MKEVGRSIAMAVILPYLLLVAILSFVSNGLVIVGEALWKFLDGPASIPIKWVSAPKWVMYLARKYWP